MSDMLSFNVSMLEAIADFLMMEPIIYIVGMVLLCIVVKVFISIIHASCT